MSTQNFIAQLMNGDLSDAKESLTDILSAKAFQALDDKKQELAQTIYNMSDAPEEEQEFEQEEVEEDQ